LIHELIHCCFFFLQKFENYWRILLLLLLQ